MRDAGCSAFAAIVVDFAVLLARRAPWRASADDGFSAFRALADLRSVAAELTLSDTSLIGGPAVRSRQTSPLAVHDSVAACGGG